MENVFIDYERLRETMPYTTQPFEHESFDGHENISYINDAETGLHAIIAIHSTALGPGAGGCRMLPYKDTATALYDVLRLSRGMTYKNAIADLPLGGGKAVIIGNPDKEKTPELLEAFGRAVERLGGAYWTAEDMNIGMDDVAIMARETRFAAGLNSGKIASGDPSPVTAKGVFEGIKVCAEHKFGNRELDGVRVAVQGIGNVGFSLCRMLHQAGAVLTVADTNEAALERARNEFQARIVKPNDIYSVESEIFSPCAGGAVINSSTIGSLRTQIVAGAANNQLESPCYGDMLAEKGILYAPDYVINGGGIINVATEILQISQPDWVDNKLKKLALTLKSILERAEVEERSTEQVADKIAQERIHLVNQETRMAV